MAEPVTVLALRQSSPERVTVQLSDGEEIESTLNVVTDLRLYRDRTLADEERQELRQASALALMKGRALALLSRRPMSAGELLQKLCDKGEDPEGASACVRWLQDNRLLDDESYASAVARHYAARGYGPGRIRQELSRRRVPREFWDEALGQRPANHEKIDKFIASRLRDPGDRVQVRKVTAALFRRGFGWDEIREALARFHAEAEYEEEA